MNAVKKYIPVSIIPLSILIWGIFLIGFFDPFSSRSIDPEYPYLINGLNFALLKFNWIGHIDHPGTPLQIFNGIVIRITHLVSGKGDIAHDVFSRPDYYLNIISIAIILLHILLVFAIGIAGLKRKIPIWQILLLQSGCLFNDVLFWLFSRVNPDVFFQNVTAIFILVYILHGYKNRAPLKFAILSGVVMALGFAVKFNYLPLLLLPLLFITTNKNRLIYAGSLFISFFLYIAPIIDKFGQYRHFLVKIARHDGNYGNGDERIFNFQKMASNIGEIVRLNPELLILIGVLIILLAYCLIKKQNEVNKYWYYFSGLLVISFIQIIMVSKHFNNYYLAPLFTIYGFIFFLISLFLVKLIKKKKTQILVSYILPILFLAATSVKVIKDFPFINKEIAHREMIKTFAEKSITGNDIWFAEPTWESAPYKENGLLYGLLYSRHASEHLPQLLKTNENFLAYDKEIGKVKQWGFIPLDIDSTVATGKNIYIYSTPGRNANELLILLQNAATRRNFRLQTDTVYNDDETDRKIIRSRAIPIPLITD